MRAGSLTRWSAWTLAIRASGSSRAMRPTASPRAGPVPRASGSAISRRPGSPSPASAARQPSTWSAAVTIRTLSPSPITRPAWLEAESPRPEQGEAGASASNAGSAATAACRCRRRARRCGDPRAGCLASAATRPWLQRRGVARCRRPRPTARRGWCAPREGRDRCGRNGRRRPPGGRWGGAAPGRS